MSYQLPSRRLVSQEDSSMIERADIPRSTFTGSWSRKTSFDAGKLYPVLCEEILPGDHMRYDMTAYVRMATPLFPIFDNMRIDTHFFFVPCRLVWSNWAKFMGEQQDPSQDVLTVKIPQLVSPAGGFAKDSLYDHFGLPVAGQLAAAGTVSVNMLPFRAYNLIYNEWFRDENLQAKLYVNMADSGDTVANFALMRRAKSHDYFSLCLPWPQKFTSPTMPIGGLAPIVGLGYGTDTAPGAAATVLETGFGAATPYAVSGQPVIRLADGDPSRPEVYADLAQATGVTINQLRQAFLVQQLLERDARGGTRYTESVFSHFGVRSPDMRLQRPEYIGGGSSPLQITPIAQTAPYEGPLGALGGAGTAVGQHKADYAATEHGYIIGLMSVKSELSYQQGLHKMWTRKSRFDFYVPSLAGLGEQAVLRQELYARGVPEEDELVFGYQERWHEYRTRVSEVVGGMRSADTGSLDAWHLAQEFQNAPTLSPEFIQEAPPMDRVLAADETAAGQQFLGDLLISRTATRPIPTYGTPVRLGRF